MKVASMVLGIVGGIMAIIFAIVFIVMGSVMISLDSDTDFDVQLEKSGSPFAKHSFWFSGSSDGMALVVLNKIGVFFLMGGIISFIGGVLGIVGGAIVKNKNIPAGILMIIAAVLCASVLFILGAIFAFIRDKKPNPETEAIAE